MFVAWALLAGLAGKIHAEDCPQHLEALQSRSMTPGQFFLETCDGKFTDEDLNDEGNAFAQAYFDFEQGQYLADYDRVLAHGLPSQYHVEDTWENFDRLRPLLSKRFHEWRRSA